MNLTQLKYFTEVVKTMNMTKAATKLHIAQPSISRSIRELENELGVSLFIRQGNMIFSLYLYRSPSNITNCYYPKKSFWRRVRKIHSQHFNWKKLTNYP